MSTFTQSWTLESGPEDAPHVMECEVEYKYSWGSPDSYWEPGDPPEAEVQNVWGVDSNNEKPIELSLTPAEEERFLEWIYQNPPEPDYGDDWYD